MLWRAHVAFASAPDNRWSACVSKHPDKRFPGLSRAGQKVLDCLVDTWLRDTEEGRSLVALTSALEARDALYSLRAKGIVRFVSLGVVDGRIPFRVEMTESGLSFF